MNKALTAALVSLSLAQFLKIPIYYGKTGNWNWNKALESGGMPSSHSTGVASLAVYVGLSKGMRSVDFALCSLFGLIVMYDAMGVRRQAGDIAIEVNQLRSNIDQLTASHPEIMKQEPQKQLKEVLGHLPVEVVAGSLLGIAAGWLYYKWTKPWFAL